MAPQRKAPGMTDLFTTSIDKTVGQGNARFLGDVANGIPRAELIERWRSGHYPDLHEGLAREAMAMRA